MSPLNMQDGTRSITELQIEKVSNILEPVLVTHADSPDYFCVTPLDAKNMEALEVRSCLCTYLIVFVYLSDCVRVPI